MEVMVHRTRKTRRQWELVAEKVGVQASSVPDVTSVAPIRTAISFEFEMAVAGGGVSVIKLSARPSSFADVLEAMMLVDAQATRDAIAYVQGLDFETPNSDEFQDGDVPPVVDRPLLRGRRAASAKMRG